MGTLFTCQGWSRRPWFEGFGLELQSGEIAVLRGPSGSGKSLLLRSLADLDPADDDGGTARLEGVAINDHSPRDWRRQVLYVAADPALVEGTADEELARIRSLGVHAGRDTAPAVWNPGLDGSARTSNLSSGEAQRLSLARALAADPRVLLLDEPTAHLDAELAAKVESALVDWVAKDHAILWVSHDTTLAERLGARTILFP